MIIYNRYINQEDHVWYDSSNIVYSKCYDTHNNKTKTIKIVFKGGRTYVYKEIDANDYINFKSAQSNGIAFNNYIKKYDAVRIADTNMDDLQSLMEDFKQEIKDNNEQKLGELVYNIKFVEKTNEFVILVGNRTLFRGTEGQISIFNLLSSLNIKYLLETVDILPNDSDELLNEIKVK